jgi:DNA polymerase III delta subunit
MDYRQARLNLKKGQLHSLYLFSGSEDTLKEEMLLEILDVMQRKGLEPDLLAH